MSKKSKSLVEDEQIIGLMQDDQYKRWITDVSRRFKSSQIKAAIKVNDEMLRFYWSLGRDIVEMKAESRWGTAFFEVLIVMDSINESVSMRHIKPHLYEKV